MNIADLLEKINNTFGRKYTTTALLPTLFLLIVAVLLSVNFLALEAFLANEVTLAFIGLIILIVSLWVASILHSSSSMIVKLFEGYYFPEPIAKVLIYRNKIWHRKNTRNIRRVIELRKRGQVSEENSLVLADLAILELQALERQAPLDETNLMPTAYGNIMRSAEVYPKERYGIEGTVIWPRLNEVLPKEMKSELAENSSQLLFLLNSSLSLYILMFYSFFLGFLQLLCTDTEYISCPMIDPGFDLRFYVFVAFIFAMLGYVLYRIALPLAEDYSQYIRASFDIYRAKLLKKLKIQNPNNPNEEFMLWRDISDFLAGSQSIYSTDYPFNSKSKDKKKKGKKKKKKKGK